MSAPQARFLSVVVRRRQDLSLAPKSLNHTANVFRWLTAFHVARFDEDMEKAGYSTDARFKAGARLRQVLKRAQKMRLVAHNIALGVPLPRNIPAAMQVRTAEEAAALLTAAEGERLYAVYHVALDRGARDGELFALDWSDFDESRGALTFVKSLEEKKGRLRIKETKTSRPPLTS